VTRKFCVFWVVLLADIESKL